MAEQTGVGGVRIERELLAVLGAAVLILVGGIVYSVTRAGSAPEPGTSLAAASLSASPTASPSPTVVPTPEPTPTPMVIAWSEVGVAAVEIATPEATVRTVSPEVARRTPLVPVIVDTTGFRKPPPRRSAPPPNSAGIARMISGALEIDHYIEVVGVVNNAMETPKDGSYAVGWYRDYALPGSGGNVVLSAHETWNHMQGPFYRLHRAKAGDEILIRMTDGRQYRYAVFSNLRYSVDNIPMAELLWPTKRPRGTEWLTLITCGGRIVYDTRGFGTYLDRDVVIAKRIG